jgi:hypothetical protein
VAPSESTSTSEVERLDQLSVPSCPQTEEMVFARTPSAPFSRQLSGIQIVVEAPLRSEDLLRLRYIGNRRLGTHSSVTVRPGGLSNQPTCRSLMLCLRQKGKLSWLPTSLPVPHFPHTSVRIALPDRDTPVSCSILCGSHMMQEFYSIQLGSGVSCMLDSPTLYRIIVVFVLLLHAPVHGCFSSLILNRLLMPPVPRPFSSRRSVPP